MITRETSRVLNREEAGLLLSSKLQAYNNTNAMVVGIPSGGTVVAASLAKALHLDLEVLPCRRINHPADNSKSIGSVSLNEVVIDPDLHDIPQDYISHQIAVIRNALRKEADVFMRGKSTDSFHFKTVIVVDDILRSGSTMLACLKDIRKQQPLKLIVAVPFVSAEAARVVGEVADEVVFNKMKPGIGFGEEYYKEFPNVEERQVKALMEGAKKELLML